MKSDARRGIAMASKYKLIQSLSRAFAIIDCFSESEQELTLNEISQKVALNINTTRGLVQTLLHYNYLSYDEEDNAYRLGLVYIEKAEIAQFDYTEKITQLIRGNLQEIADKYSVSSRLLSVDYLSTTSIIVRNPSHSRYVLAVHDQTDFPLYASATGKLILAYLEDSERAHVLENMNWVKYGKNTILDQQKLEKDLATIAKNEIAYEKEELGDGYSSIAMPIFQRNELIYSISIAGTTQIIADNLEQIVQDVQSIRDAIDEKMA